MTPEAQNIALAEACGWKWYRIPVSAHIIREGRPPLRCLFLPACHEIEQSPEWLVKADGTERICNMQYMAREGHVRDYFKDLNAQFEAWKTLTDEQKFAHRDFVNDCAEREEIWFEEAQARFGCECLLRALGKWVE